MLFGGIVFGPVQSRRLGVSLGVNLLPVEAKYCNFDCIYCECGWSHRGVRPEFPSVGAFEAALEGKLTEMRTAARHLDVITFAGNGEPTIHPEFPEIVDITLRLRDAYYPGVRVTVLSNATFLGRRPVFDALKRVDLPVLKLDSAVEETFRLINRPLQGGVTAERVIADLKRFGGENFTLQTLFFRGEYDGECIDNTTEEEVMAWLGALEEIGVRRCMVYSLDRETPAEDLVRLERSGLEAIADRARALGVEVQVNV